MRHHDDDVHARDDLGLMISEAALADLLDEPYEEYRVEPYDEYVVMQEIPVERTTRIPAWDVH